MIGKDAEWAVTIIDDFINIHLIPMNEQFVRACNRLDEWTVKSIQVCFMNVRGRSPFIKARSLEFGSDSWNSEIHDEEMGDAGWSWRQYGKAIKNSEEVELLFLQSAGESLPEADQCLQTFFEEVKENKSIKSLYLDIPMSMSVSAMDLRYFFQNNVKLQQIRLGSISLVSPVQSIHVATALRDVNLERFSICIDCNDMFTNNGTLEQIIWACQKVKTLSLQLLENYHITSLAELLQNPGTTLEELWIDLIPHQNFNAERAENEVLVGLAQNSRLKILMVDGLFEGNGSAECFEGLLCNTATIETVCQSNHKLEDIVINRSRMLSHYCKELLELNKIANKGKVVQHKLLQCYFSGHFDTSPIANMPLGLLAEILAIDVKKKQSAVFNILKKFPGLCDVNSRNVVWSNRSSYPNNESGNKRPKVAL